MAQTIGLIIPTYNRADMLREAIESALAQTRVPDQIIVVDDGSTDGTWELLRRYPPPVYAFRQQNRGRSAARNEGLSHCRSDLICFLDSDDLLLPDSIESRLAWLDDHPDYGAVYGMVGYVDAEGEPIPREVAGGHCHTGDLFHQLARYNTIPILAIMIRREHLPTPPYFDEGLERWEDWDFLLRLSAGCKIGCVDKTVGLYRQHAGMTIARGSIVGESAMIVQERVYRMEAFRSLPAGVRARIYTSHALGRMRAGYVREARECLRRGIDDVPWYLPAYATWLLSLTFPKSAGLAVRLWGILRWSGRSR